MSDVQVFGPFQVTLGPKPRIVCHWCEKPVALRNTGNGLLILQCTRPTCEADRPTNHRWRS